jgi:hypothetical protein
MVGSNFKEVKMVGLARKFDGKTFRFFDSYMDKKEAGEQARQLRVKGKKIRTTHYKSPLLPYFELWVRG